MRTSFPKNDTRWIYMKLIEKAMIFAAQKHEHQYRKSTTIPYITHPFMVGMYLQQANCTEEVIAAGILHDTLEDTNTTLDELTNEFGEKVAHLVVMASEHDKSLSWEERKQHTIEMLATQSLEDIQVIVADKLHNLRSICADFERDGDSIWSRFNRGKSDQQWYYISIANAVSKYETEFSLIGELQAEVSALFR